MPRVAQQCGTYRSTRSPSLPSGDLVLKQGERPWPHGTRAAVFGRPVTDDHMFSSEAGLTTARGRTDPAPPARLVAARRTPLRLGSIK